MSQIAAYYAIVAVKCWFVLIVEEQWLEVRWGAARACSTNHPLTRSASKSVLTPPHSGVLGQARTSLMRASMLSEGSLKNDIQSSWSGIRAIRWGSSTNWTPRSIIVDLAASRSSTLK